jgi:hypothetical protein
MQCACGAPLGAFLRVYGAGVLREETLCLACGRFWSAYRASAPPEARDDPHTTIITRAADAPPKR